MSYQSAASVGRNKRAERTRLVRQNKACWFLPLRTLKEAIKGAGL